MNTTEMQKAINEAKQTLDAADEQVRRMVRMIHGRLRKSSAWSSDLTALKRELRDWDMHRSCWIDRK